MKSLLTLKVVKSLCLVFIFLSSCAFHSGMMTGNASLSNNNFKILGVAVGAAKTTKIFGIGGVRKESLIYTAKKDLYQNNKLKPGQALANITVDFKETYYLFVNTTSVIVHAEIVDFNGTKNSENNFQIENYKGFSEGEKVYYGIKFYKIGTIQQLKSNVAIIKTSSGSTSFSYNRIFKSQGSSMVNNKKIKVGSILKFGSQGTATLIAYNSKYILVRNSKSKIIKLSKNDL